MPQLNTIGNMINNKAFNLALLLTLIGEFLLPWILSWYYDGYNSKTMVMSALGNPQSPVSIAYNIWLIWLGCFLAFTAIVYFLALKAKFPIVSVLLSLSIGVFAIGAGLLSGIFSVNENKNIITISSKIHGIAAAIGFMALLFFPLLNAILEIKENDVVFGVVCIAAFILALVFFACFIMEDKKQFQNTILKYEGLLERLTLFCMYVPFVYKTMSNLFF